MNKRVVRVILVCLSLVLLAGIGSAAYAAPQSQSAPQGQGGPRGPAGGRWLVKGTADHLGLEPSAVVSELKQGKTLAQIAVAHGKTRESLRAALIATWEQRLDRLAKGDLKLTADEVRVLKGIAARSVDLALDRQMDVNKAKAR